MTRNVQRRTAMLATTVALLAAGPASAAGPVQGSVSGPVTIAKGKTFTLKTALSPSGSSKVTVTSKTTVTEQVSGTAADLVKGACVMASGTKKGSAVVAARISITPAVGGSCSLGGRRQPGARPGGPRPGAGSASRGGGFTPPANFGFAFGVVTAVKGSTLTVKGPRGATTVDVSAKTQIDKTKNVGPAGVKVGLCAFVFGTSTDKGVTVNGRDVRLSAPTNGSCRFSRPGP